MRSDRLKEELARAKLKAAEWQAKVKDLERRITLQENLEIVQAVRSVSATPEELRKILAQLTNMRDAPAENGTGGQGQAAKSRCGQKGKTRHRPGSKKKRIIRIR